MINIILLANLADTHSLVCTISTLNIAFDDNMCDNEETHENYEELGFQLYLTCRSFYVIRDCLMRVV